MSIFSHKQREAFYSIIVQELEKGEVDKELMSKAFVQADGNENKAKARYIRMRADVLFQQEQLDQRKEKIRRQNELEVLKFLKIKKSKDEEELLNRLDADTRQKYVVLRNAYGNRVLKFQNESDPQFRQRIARFWNKHQTRSVDPCVVIGWICFSIQWLALFGSCCLAHERMPLWTILRALFSGNSHIIAEGVGSFIGWSFLAIIALIMAIIARKHDDGPKLLVLSGVTLFIILIFK